MDHSFFIKPLNIDPVVWRPEIPLAVIVRCTVHGVPKQRRPANPASLVFTWLAFRWFTAAYPKRQKFSSRLIAEWMGASQDSVLVWSNLLVDLGLLLRTEGSVDDNRFKRPQPFYSIPLQDLEAESNRISQEMVLKWRNKSDNREIPPETQLPLDFSHQDAEENSAHAPNSGHGYAPNSGHGHAPNSGQAMPLIRGTWMDGSDGWMDSTPAPKKRGRPPKIPPAPTAEVYAAHPIWIVGGPLPAHPYDLWTNACPAPTAAHADQLAALAAEHDAPTDGHGWYWVGRAILAGLHAQEQLGHPNYLRNLLIRWRAEDSYGSDLPRPTKEIADARPTRRPRPARPARSRSRVVPAPPPAHHGAAPAGSAASDDRDLSPDEIAAELARLDAQARIQLEQRRRTRG